MLIKADSVPSGRAAASQRLFIVWDTVSLELESEEQQWMDSLMWLENSWSQIQDESRRHVLWRFAVW